MAKDGSADFLVEVGTEELPPKALRRLKDCFADGIVEGLEQSRLNHGEVKSYASPRRLAVLVSDLASAQDDREVTRKGPPVSVAFDNDGEPTKAGLAFAVKCGVDIAKLGRQKGAADEWLSYTATESGRGAEELMPDVVQRSLDALPIPRRMRWGAKQAEFVRPVHWLVMLHGKSVVNGSVLGVNATNNSKGHRFHAPGDIAIAAPDKYASLLAKKGYVVADFDVRKDLMTAGVQRAAKEAGGSPVGDDELYDEVTALTEWPVPLTGRFDDTFLSLPKEVIVATLTGHQRYFPVQDKDGTLLPAFVTVANIESREPDRVRDGNERVIRPRLADAAFFWDTDRQTALGERIKSLENVVYQKGLGSLRDKADRVAVLVANFAQYADANADSAVRAAQLARCDLLTGMVGEFPELQGTMGSYYAAASGESTVVSVAIGEQYLPRFAGDRLPASKEGQVLAVADKLDTLAGVFALDKKPTGNRDPFGLRRAVLGVIRILIEKEIDIDIADAIRAAVEQQPVDEAGVEATVADLYEFCIDRLRSYMLDNDADLTADMFAAVRCRRPRSLLDFEARLKAVKAFMCLDAAASLAAANKRTANILRQANATPGATDAGLLTEGAEIALHNALQSAQKGVQPLIDGRSYADALQMLAKLREPVDKFFDDVMVMAEDDAIRNNRLALLSELRSLFLGIADISRLTSVQE